MSRGVLEFPTMDDDRARGDDVIPAATARPRYGPYDLLTRAELAAFFGKCERSIDRANFPCVLVGGTRFYPWASLVEYLRKRTS